MIRPAHPIIPSHPNFCVIPCLRHHPHQTCFHTYATLKHTFTSVEDVMGYEWLTTPLFQSKNMGNGFQPPWLLCRIPFLRHCSHQTHAIKHFYTCPTPTPHLLHSQTHSHFCWRCDGLWVIGHSNLSVKKCRKHIPANQQLCINEAKPGCVFFFSFFSTLLPDLRVELTVRVAWSIVSVCWVPCCFTPSQPVWLYQYIAASVVLALVHIGVCQGI